MTSPLFTLYAAFLCRPSYPPGECLKKAEDALALYREAYPEDLERMEHPQLAARDTHAEEERAIELARRVGGEEAAQNVLRLLANLAMEDVGVPTTFELPLAEDVQVSTYAVNLDEGTLRHLGDEVIGEKGEAVKVGTAPPANAEERLSNETTAGLDSEAIVRGVMKVAEGLPDGSEPYKLDAPKPNLWRSGEAHDPVEAVKRALATAEKLHGGTAEPTPTPKPKRSRKKRNAKKETPK